jgi:hypothetical protein
MQRMDIVIARLTGRRRLKGRPIGRGLHPDRSF